MGLEGDCRTPNEWDYTEEEMENLRVMPKLPWELKGAAKVATKLYTRYLRAGQAEKRLTLAPDPKKEILLEGGRIELICPGLNRSNNHLPFHWTQDGKIFSGRRPKPRFSIGKWDRDLAISPILAEDTGHYECFEWVWDKRMRPLRNGQFIFHGQLTLQIRSLTEAIAGGALNFGLTAFFAFLVLSAWIPLYAYCVVREGEKGLAQEDEADYREFLARHKPDESDYELPSEAKEEDKSGRSAVTFLRDLEASRRS